MTCDYEEERDAISNLYEEVESGYKDDSDIDQVLSQLEDARDELTDALNYIKTAICRLEEAKDYSQTEDAASCIKDALNGKRW